MVEGLGGSRRNEELSSSTGEARAKAGGTVPGTAHSRATPGKGWYWSQPGGMTAPLKEGPPIPSTSQNGRALPWWWETGPWHLVPRLLSSYLGSGLRQRQLAAVSTLFPGGLRLRPPRCHPPRPRFCAVVAAVFQAAETLEGPASGAGPLITVS